MCPELRTPLANVSKRNLFNSAFALLFGANVFRKFLLRLCTAPISVPKTSQRQSGRDEEGNKMGPFI